MQQNIIDIDEAVKSMANSLYGNNEEISELQRLFAKTQLYNMKRACQRVDENLFAEIDIDIEQVALDLEQEVDRRMPEPNTPDYNKFLAMKAYSFNLRSTMMTPNVNNNDDIAPSNPEFLERILELLESIKLEPVAVYFYVDALNLLGTFYISTNHNEAIKYLLKAEITHNIFKEKFQDVNKALTPFDIFDVPRHERQPFWCLWMAHHYTNIFLFRIYNKIHDGDMKIKYAIASIRGKISIEVAKGNKYYVNKIMKEMVDELHSLIINWHFHQVNHLLAGFMANLVEYRRSLPKGRREEVNFAQGLVSQAFALWAHETVYCSFAIITGHDLELEPNNAFNQFASLMIPGIEVYENQFPCQCITNPKKLVSALKKGKLWCQRALDLIQVTSPMRFRALETMKELEELQRDVENVFDGADTSFCFKTRKDV